MIHVAHMQWLTRLCGQLRRPIVNKHAQMCLSNADATGGDAYINEGSTFDTCGGHPSTNGGGEYHVSSRRPLVSRVSCDVGVKMFSADPSKAVRAFVDDACP